MGGAKAAVQAALPDGLERNVFEGAWEAVLAKLLKFEEGAPHERTTSDIDNFWMGFWSEVSSFLFL